MGLYHPAPELHHIKKENIGLIEVMGLAVLPSRLAEEIKLMEDALVNGKASRTILGLLPTPTGALTLSLAIPSFQGRMCVR